MADSDPDAEKVTYRPLGASSASSKLVRHVIPDLRSVSLTTYVLAFLATCGPAAATLLACSDLTEAGEIVYMFIHELDVILVGLLSEHLGSVLPETFVSNSYPIFFASAGIGIFMAWLADIPRWKVRFLRLLHLTVIVVMLLIGMTLYADDAPSVLVILGIMATIAAVYGVRRVVDEDSQQFSFIFGTLFLLISITFWSVWAAWAFTPALGGTHQSEHTRLSKMIGEEMTVHGYGLKGMRGKEMTYFLLWAEPAILAAMYFLLSLFMFTRGQFHVPEDGVVHTDEVYVGRELKFVIFCFIMLAGGAWVAASLAAKGMDLSTMVLRLCAAVLTIICIYVVMYIGRERIISAAQEDPWIHYVIELLTSDWMKAIMLLAAWPAVPAYFALECIHQCVRSLLGCCRLIEAEAGCRCLTVEGRARLDRLVAWDWASVLPKTILVGIAFFTLNVGAAIGTKIFLSWLAEVIASWALYWILGILFLVGLMLFLIPVVPGLPIYLVSGIVVVQKCQSDHMSFEVGVTIASVLCWAIKLCSNIVLMKCVGEPFADNVSVKMTVGTHTPTMRAAAIVLTEKGLTAPKVAVLVGGPDWPTAVICAMLKVPIISMLIGTSPVFFLIVPVVVSAAYLLRSGTEKEKGNDDLASTYSNISNYMMMVSAVVQMGSMVVAGMYLQMIKTNHKEELDEVREEDKPVLEAVKRAEDDQRMFEAKTGWDKMPIWLDIVLFVGSFSVCAMMHIASEYFCSSFEGFELTDKISDKDGLDGNPINVIKTWGWISIACLSVGIFCLVVRNIWCKVKASKLDGEESAVVAGALE